MEHEFKICPKCGLTGIWVSDITIKYRYERQKGKMNKRTLQCPNQHTFTINYGFTPDPIKI